MAWHQSQLTVLMVRRRRGSYRWVSLSRSSPLHRESCHPQDEVLREGALRTAAYARRFGWALSSRITCPTTWVRPDDVGFSPVSVVGHCMWVMPPSTWVDRGP